MAPPTAEAIKMNIQAEDNAVWDQAEARPAGLDLFEDDVAHAIADAWADVEGGLLIASVPVTGGSSAPGGPLVAGTATLSPGMLAHTASFSSINTKFSSSFPDGATEELLALVQAIAQGIGQQFDVWVPGYSANLMGIGGSCAWVAPTPATPSGTPGPWTGGEIQPFALAGGSSTGDQGMTASSLDAAIGSAADPQKLKRHQNTLMPALQALITAMAAGFATTWTQWKSLATISGGAGTGTSSPPNGTTVGTVASPHIG